MAILPYSIREGYYDRDNNFYYDRPPNSEIMPNGRISVSEDTYTNPYQSERHLKMQLIDPDRLVEVNELKEITNPVAFIRKGVPTPDGLWSNEIFGITQYQRANTFAYIDLGEEFINPLIYKLWCKIK